jgi:hypothetical protein
MVGWLKKYPKKKFAIKAMKKTEIMENKHVDHVHNEKNILSTIHHPFVVKSNLHLNPPVRVFRLFLRLALHIYRDGTAGRRRPVHLPQKHRKVWGRTDIVSRRKLIS